MVATPKYLTAVTIVTGTNDVIRATDGAGSYDATIAAGTYYVEEDGSADCLLQAIQDALESGRADSWVVELSGAKKLDVVNNSNAWSIDWDHANTTFNGELLGLDISAAFGAGAGDTDTGDYRVKVGWWATTPVEYDDEGQKESPSKIHVAKSGRPWGVQVGAVRTVRTIRHAYESKHMVISDSSYTNYDWQTFWSTACDGTVVRYYPDATDSTSYYEGVFDEATSTRPEVTRYGHGVALYSFHVVLIANV